MNNLTALEKKEQEYQELQDAYDNCFDYTEKHEIASKLEILEEELNNFKFYVNDKQHLPKKLLVNNICKYCKIEMLEQGSSFLCKRCNLEVKNIKITTYDNNIYKKPQNYENKNHFISNLEMILGNKISKTFTTKAKDKIINYIKKSGFDRTTMSRSDMFMCLKTLKLTSYNKYISQVMYEVCDVPYPIMPNDIKDNLIQFYSLVTNKLNEYKFASRKNSFINFSVANKCLEYLYRKYDDTRYLDYIYLFRMMKIEDNNINLNYLFKQIIKDLEG